MLMLYRRHKHSMKKSLNPSKSLLCPHKSTVMGSRKLTLPQGCHISSVFVQSLYYIFYIRSWDPEQDLEYTKRPKLTTEALLDQQLPFSVRVLVSVQSVMSFFGVWKSSSAFNWKVISGSFICFKSLRIMSAKTLFSISSVYFDRFQSLRRLCCSHYSPYCNFWLKHQVKQSRIFLTYYIRSLDLKYVQEREKRVWIYKIPPFNKATESVM